MNKKTERIVTSFITLIVFVNVNMLMTDMTFEGAIVFNLITIIAYIIFYLIWKVISKLIKKRR